MWRSVSKQDEALHVQPTVSIRDFQAHLRAEMLGKTKSLLALNNFPVGSEIVRKRKRHEKREDMIEPVRGILWKPTNSSNPYHGQRWSVPAIELGHSTRVFEDEWFEKLPVHVSHTLLFPALGDCGVNVGRWRSDRPSLCSDQSVE